MTRLQPLFAFAAATLLTGILASSLPTEAASRSQARPLPTPTRWESCGAWDGLPCSPPGAHFKCYNIYPIEPGRCGCNGGTWHCG